MRACARIERERERRRERERERDVKFKVFYYVISMIKSIYNFND